MEGVTRDGENVTSISWESPLFSDNSPSPVTLRLIEGVESGQDFEIGEHIITYTVEDGSGNSNTCSFIVLVLGET